MILSPIFLVLIILSITILIVFVVLYNRLNTCYNQIQNAASSLDALFIKRHDLIPNLITVIKQYKAYEKEVLEKITALRVEGSTAQEYKEDNPLTKAIGNLMVQVENYPDLKADRQFERLQYIWTEIEAEISSGRRYLSASITWYNDYIKKFPSNIIAGIFGYKLYTWERASKEQRAELSAQELF